MKIILLTFSLIFLKLLGHAQQDSINISGRFDLLKDNSFTISWTDNGAKNGSAVVKTKNGIFNVKVPMQSAPVLAWLYLPRENNEGLGSAPVNFFLFNQDIILKGNPYLPGGLVLKGDKQNNLLNDLQHQTAAAELKYRSFVKESIDTGNKLSPEQALKNSEAASAAYKEKCRIAADFLDANPEAFASIYILYLSANSYSADELIEMWEGLRSDFKQTVLGQAVAKEISNLMPTRAGNLAFAFDRVDLKGKRVNNEVMKGKVYLLDFWGSWCGPCRAGHPHLKSLYDKYRSKGFEIVAIAHERGKNLEDAKASWQKAIAEDKLDWVHVLNQDDIEKQDLVKMYHVRAFPTKILVGADGKIICRTTSGASDAIDIELKKIYGF